MTDFRALCAELLAEWDSYSSGGDAWDRAREALAQAEPVKTPKPIRPDCFEFAMDFLGDPEEAELRNYIEALEARQLAQPKPVGLTPDHVNLICFALEREPWATWLRRGGCLESAHCELSDLMLAVLARWGRPAIELLPVSERPWEREGWCDVEGRCWWFNHAGIPEWQLASDGPYGDFSLPHYALPVPTSQQGP